MRKFWVVLLLVFLLPLTCSAETVDYASQSNLFIQADQIVDGVGLYAGSTVQIDGTVKGTTFIAAEKVILNGTIHGDLFVVAQQLTLHGTVTGNRLLLLAFCSCL